MKQSALILIISLVTFATFAQVDYQKRAKKNLPYLIRNEVLMDQIKIDDEGIRIYPLDDLEEAEHFVKWEEAEDFLNGNKLMSAEKTTSIKGARIALDPGHFANNLETAILERKFMRIGKEDLGTKKDIAFFEADLAWKTAHILAQRLEKRGAIVFITRKKGKSSFGLNFKQWKKKKYQQQLSKDLKENSMSKETYDWYINKAKDRDIARYMNKKDLVHRAGLINAFQPNLTLMIHYNATSDVVDSKGNFTPQTKNYCMAFTGGGFMTKELSTPESRLNFLRLLLSEDLEQSIHLSKAILHQHVEKVKVDIVPSAGNNLKYLEQNSVYSGEPGVFCRNLAMTRTVKGPICFGESLVQDHVNEVIVLSLKNYKESGVRTSSRVKLVVDAFEYGIMDYLAY